MKEGKRGTVWGQMKALLNTRKGSVRQACASAPWPKIKEWEMKGVTSLLPRAPDAGLQLALE